MTRIRVNPSSLISSASSVVSIASQISKIGDGLLHATHSAPSYSGQFGPRVVAIALSSLAHSKKNQGFLTNQSSILKRKASAFQTADSTSISNLRKKSLFPLIDSSINLRLLSIIMGISITQLLLLIKLGFLKLPSATLPWSLISKNITTPIYNLLNKQQDSSECTQSTSSEIDNSNISNKQEEKESPKQSTNTSSIKAYGIAEKVPTDDKENTSYGRGNGKTKSNCTWYAAEAVKTYTNGEVLPSKWGNANEWIDSAKNSPDVSEVNSIPSEGSVVVWNYEPYGHVGFVEKVEYSDGKVIITWSEENYGGEQPYWENSKSEIITDDNDVKRWRITTEYPVNSDGEITSSKIEGFIHF